MLNKDQAAFGESKVGSSPNIFVSESRKKTKCWHECVKMKREQSHVIVDKEFVFSKLEYSTWLSWIQGAAEK